MKTKTNRREFLKQSIAFSSSLFLGSAYSRVLGANDSIRVAIVGTGWKGGEHIKSFRKLSGVRVTAICDVDRNILTEQAQQFKDTNEKVAQYTDVRKALDDDCLFALGLDALPRRALSFGNRFLWHDDGQTPNTQLGVFDYTDFPIIIELRNLPRVPGIRAMDHFREIRMGNIIQCEHGYFAGGRGCGWIYSNDGKKLKAFPGDGGATHQANFIEAVRNRNRTILKAEIEQGHRSVTLCHMANTSYKHVRREIYRAPFVVPEQV